eukprot:2028840-Pyramimonas_sp.AAC.1
MMALKKGTHKRESLERVRDSLQTVDPRFIKECASPDDMFETVERHLNQAGGKLFSTAARPPLCEDYPQHCADRRRLLKQRTVIRAGMSRGSEEEGT